jgi:hypothetical protein
LGSLFRENVVKKEEEEKHYFSSSSSKLSKAFFGPPIKLDKGALYFLKKNRRRRKKAFLQDKADFMNELDYDLLGSKSLELLASPTPPPFKASPRDPYPHYLFQAYKRPKRGRNLGLAFSNSFIPISGTRAPPLPAEHNGINQAPIQTLPDSLNAPLAHAEHTTTVYDPLSMLCGASGFASDF